MSVLDENDSAPVFIPASYIQSISESASPGYIALRVVANDADEGATVQYSIVKGNNAGNFVIDTYSGKGGYVILRLIANKTKQKKKEFIPVGCVPPAH